MLGCGGLLDLFVFGLCMCESSRVILGLLRFVRGGTWGGGPEALASMRIVHFAVVVKVSFSCRHEWGGWLALMVSVVSLLRLVWCHALL